MLGLWKSGKVSVGEGAVKGLTEKLEDAEGRLRKLEGRQNELELDFTRLYDFVKRASGRTSKTRALDLEPTNGPRELTEGEILALAHTRSPR